MIHLIPKNLNYLLILKNQMFLLNQMIQMIPK